MKKLFLIFGVLAICAAFSGCTVFETDTEALMRPPVFSAEQEKLNAALAEVTGGSYELKYPQNGEMNSAFIFEDLDGDGTEEAIAFYSLYDESTRINVLKNEGEKWTSVYEAAGFYGDIEKIEFAKMEDNRELLIVKWEEEAAVYRYEDERLATLYRTVCDGIEVSDVNGDGSSEIVVFGGKISGRSLLNLVYSKDGEIVVSDEINIHSEYKNIYSAFSGKFTDSTSAYFIDSEIYEGVYLTEMITLNEGEVDRSFVADYVEYEDSKEDEDESSSSGAIVIVGGGYGKRGIFLRNTKVCCMDTNKDGIYELPVEVREDYAQDESEEVYFLQYMQYTGSSAVTVWNGVANTAEGYLFAVPAGWNDKIEARISPSGEELEFVNTATGEIVLSIYSVLKSDYQDKYEEFTLGAEHGDKNYYIKAPFGENSEFYIAPENYAQSFIFTE